MNAIRFWFLKKKKCKYELAKWEIKYMSTIVYNTQIYASMFSTFNHESSYWIGIIWKNLSREVRKKMHIIKLFVEKGSKCRCTIAKNLDTVYEES